MIPTPNDILAWPQVSAHVGCSGSLEFRYEAGILERGGNSVEFKHPMFRCPVCNSTYRDDRTFGKPLQEALRLWKESGGDWREVSEACGLESKYWPENMETAES